MGSIQVNLIDLLLEKERDIEIFTRHGVGKRLLNIYQRDLVRDDVTIPYDRIAEYVYKNENSSEDNEILNSKISFIISHFDGSEKDKRNLVSNLEKIRNNYILSQTQKNFIVQTTIQTESLLTDLEIQAKNIEISLKDNKKIADDISDTKSSIYTDFIAIIGVFSAFVFVMFGGIEIARAIFDIGDDLAKLDLSKIISISSLMLVGILILMYSLLLWIARITGKDFGNCYSKRCKDGCQHKWMHLFMRHSFFFAMLILLSLTTIVSHIYF